MAPQETLAADEFESLLAFAHDLADGAAAQIMPHFRKPLTVENKAKSGKFDPVTEADRAAETVIREAITERYPDHAIVGEELGERAGTTGLTWWIDPIDGTKAFITGSPLWGTLIGLTQDDTPVLGLMNQPFTGERYWSGRDAAWYRGPQGDERRIATRRCSEIAAAVVSTTSPDLLEAGFERERFEALSGQARLARYGGDCYAYCQLAAGHIDLVVEAGLKPHDIVALIPIVERAGGAVSGWAGEDANAGGRIVAAGDPVLHEIAIGVLGAG